MSLHHLGIAHFPILHRQYTSPKAMSFSDSSSIPDLTQDSKDVLIERLNDLVVLLSTAKSLEAGAISSIHLQVDNIEQLLRSSHKPSAVAHDAHEENLAVVDDDKIWGPATPTRNVKLRLPAISRSGSARSSLCLATQMTSGDAMEIVSESEDLATRLSTTVAELQQRKAEVDNVHDLLQVRCQAKAERILLLEYRIKEMEEDFESNQAELKFLRIQVQAIEAQCSPLLHRDVDPELTESIANWKIDWEDINRKSQARRHQSRLLPNRSSGSSTFVDSHATVRG